MRRAAVAAALAVVLGAGCSGDAVAPTVTATPRSTAATSGPSSPDAAPAVDAGEIVELEVVVVRRIPHDTTSFTQGLAFDAAGRLFESTGLVGRSKVRELDPETGAVLASRDLPADQFGEGLTVVGDELVQLTWQDGIAHRYDPSLEGRGSWTYEGEGWGLTHDGDTFLRSDGTSRITRHDAATFEPVGGPIDVTVDGGPVEELNELEWVDGALWANVWYSDDVLRIDPSTGRVDTVVDASSLWQAPERTEEMVLNGIAHRPGDPPTRLWLTGKLWPEIFVVDLVPRRER